ncbi:MAG: SDR family oxidoreductase [Polaromonas sp.]|nr:SDR family oxidoreductase [Polaromonas sp.]
MTLLVTGASGFVGRALCAELRRRGNFFKAAVRAEKTRARGANSIVVGNSDAFTDWSVALTGVQTVLHLAARVHVMHQRVHDPLAEFRATNTAGTLNLARQAAQAGAKRLVFVSSIKVNGEYSLPGRPFRESDVPAPQDAYAVSKHEAETGLREIADSTGLEVTVIRPPLVYGPCVKANFLSLMQAVQRGLPLPFGSIDNTRSLVGLDNLVDLILLCSTHIQAANQTFLVSDGHDLSTPDLVLRLADALNVPPRLLPIPVWALKMAGTILGKRNAINRLCGNLQVDISHTRQRLGWTPPVSLDAGLQCAVTGLPGQ